MSRRDRSSEDPLLLHRNSSEATALAPEMARVPSTTDSPPSAPPPHSRRRNIIFLDETSSSSSSSPPSTDRWVEEPRSRTGREMALAQQLLRTVLAAGAAVTGYRGGRQQQPRPSSSSPSSTTTTTTSTTTTTTSGVVADQGHQNTAARKFSVVVVQVQKDPLVQSSSSSSSSILSSFLPESLATALTTPASSSPVAQHVLTPLERRVFSKHAYDQVPAGVLAAVTTFGLIMGTLHWRSIFFRRPPPPPRGVMISSSWFSRHNHVANATTSSTAFKSTIPAPTTAPARSRPSGNPPPKPSSLSSAPRRIHPDHPHPTHSSSTRYAYWALDRPAGRPAPVSSNTSAASTPTMAAAASSTTTTTTTSTSSSSSWDDFFGQMQVLLVGLVSVWVGMITSFRCADSRQFLRDVAQLPLQPGPSVWCAQACPRLLQQTADWTTSSSSSLKTPAPAAPRPSGNADDDPQHHQDDNNDDDDDSSKENKKEEDIHELWKDPHTEALALMKELVFHCQQRLSYQQELLLSSSSSSSRSTSSSSKHEKENDPHVLLVVDIPEPGVPLPYLEGPPGAPRSSRTSDRATE